MVFYGDKSILSFYIRKCCTGVPRHLRKMHSFCKVMKPRTVLLCHENVLFTVCCFYANFHIKLRVSEVKSSYSELWCYNPSPETIAKSHITMAIKIEFFKDFFERHRYVIYR